MQAALLLAFAMLPALGHAQNAGVSVPLMLAPDSERQGFVRIINESNQAGSVRITAYDDTGTAASPSSEIRLEAGSVLHFNSDDLAGGNASKGISRIGEPSQGHWRLSVETALQDVQVLAFVRTRDGFLTAMHDTLPRNDDGQLVAKMLNPGSNRNQESKLRLVNTGANRESVSIRGVDDQGGRAGPVRLTLNAGQSRTLSAYDLENGASGLTGTLGDGAGKWRLLVDAGQSVVGMGLLETSIGPITNTSTTGVPAMAMTQTPGAQDDHGNGFNDATNLAIDGRQSGRIEPAGESDYFRVRVTESGTLTVYTTGELDTRGYLYDGNERQLATNDDGSSSDEGNFRIEREVDAGTYYVRVEAYVRSVTGSYTVHAEFAASEDEDEDDHGSGFNDATNLAIDGRQSGRIEPAGESDYFRVRVTESGTLTVYSTGGLDTYGYLHDGNERQLATNDDGGAGANFRIEREVDAGTYYVRVRAFSSSRTGDYTVHAEFDASTETPEPPEETGPYGAYALGDPILREWAGRDGNSDVYWDVVHGSNQMTNWSDRQNTVGDRNGSETQAEADRLALKYCNELPRADLGSSADSYKGGPNNCSIVFRYSGTGQCLVYATDIVVTGEPEPYQYEFGYVHFWAVVPEAQRRAKQDELRERCATEGMRLHYEGFRDICGSNYYCLD